MKIQSYYAVFFLFLLLFPFFTITQSQHEPDCFRIYLSDKAGTSYSIENPGAFLSDRAIAKRERFSIPVTEQDLPVNQSYINQIKAISPDIQVISISKWLNFVTIFYPEPLLLDSIRQLAFVDSLVGISTIGIYLENTPPVPSNSENVVPAFATKDDSNYGSATYQIEMLNGHFLHEQGFRGENMLIAVLDGGWIGFDKLTHFDNVRVVGTRDLDPFNDNVYSGIQHGTNVTSIMAMDEPGVFIGTAPKASYFFVRTEVNWTEQHFEEDLMVMGFELADSLGADVINASLGYTVFEGFPYQQWTPQQSDGKQSVSSRAASMLAGKGVILVNAAGNEGSREWHYIGRPSDATDILAIGAAAYDSTRASFSSFGYSADGRVKPDVSALGEATATIFEDGYLGFSNGTSLASPIIAGLTACLWQALPHKTTYGIMALIRESAHLFHNPNPELGYGIPNFAWASSGQTTYTPNNIRYTNPVSSILKIENQDLNIKSIQFFDMQGKLICVSENKDESVLTVNVSNWNNGVYIGKAILKDGSQMAMKIIKY